LSDWLISSLVTGTPIYLIDDVLFSPLDIAQLPALIERVIRCRRSGIFNVGSRGGMTKADFAVRLAAEVGFSIKNECRRSAEDLNRPAHRPKDMRLDSSLFEENFGIELPTLEQTISSIAKSYRDDVSPRGLM